MPISTANPATDEQGNEYPHVLISLAVSGRPQGGNVAASVAMTAQPYRIVDGEIVTCGPPRKFRTGDAFTEAASDAALAAAVQTIMGAVQQFVTDKGL